MKLEIPKSSMNIKSAGRRPSQILRPFFTKRDSPASLHFSVPNFSGRGFTLLELMMVLTLILILASFALPTYRVAVQRAREAVLRNDLYTMRKLIDQFTLDQRRPPGSLAELVEGGYLRGGVPKDPITNSDETWHVDNADVPLGSDQTVSGIVDVHSGSDAPSLEGTPYSSW